MKMIKELENKKVKYLHIMIVNNAKHNNSIIKMINNKPDFFNKEDHIFIVANEDLYKSIIKDDNVYFDENIIKKIKILKQYANQCEYVFFHSLNIKYTFLMSIPKRITNKIIWITWGHDLYRKAPKDIKQKIKEKIYSITKGKVKEHKVKKFYAIGVGFKYDIIEIKRKFGNNIKILPMLYGYEEGKKIYIDNIIKDKEKKEIDNNPYKIMIGHCAYQFLRHIEIMDLLKKYKDENLLISLVLSYGDMEYARKVEEYAIQTFGNDKVEIIRKLMSPMEYIEYLNTVDICILDYKHQAALGNFWRLLYLEKKIFLNKDGILKLFANFEGAETYCVENIKNMNFEQFTKRLNDPQSCKKSVEFYIDENNILNMWKNSINELEN